MKHAITRIKGLKDCLPFLAHHMQFPELLYVGRPDKKIKLLPREVLGNWLVCAAVNFENKNDNLTICSDPTGGDGILQDKVTGESWETEHVMCEFDKNPKEQSEAVIVKSIQAKQKKGPQYALKKRLIVFLEGVGRWVPDKLARLIKQPLLFHSVWGFGLLGNTENEYIYYVTQINKKSLAWEVHINKTFTSWYVERIK